MDQPEDQVAQTQFLLDRAAKGDGQAYDDLIDRASDRLLKLTRKMLWRCPKHCANRPEHASPVDVTITVTAA